MAKKSKRQKNEGGIVYSTNPEYAFADLFSKLSPETERVDMNLKIWLDRKGGNKVVTRIEGLEGAEEKLQDLKKKIQNLCGAGGTLKDYEILIQGDHRDKVLKFLQEEGYKAKKAGG
jgi:translation initiation factor 1